MIRISTPLALLLTATAIAAEQPTKPLETIVVTASRIPISRNNSGSSISIINRTDIERRGVVYVTDVLRNIPGVAVSRSGTFGSQTQVRLRGAEANHVLVFIDGVEANDPAIGDEFQFEHLIITEIERIEIVRGPQSALWGSDAVGGVINVITRRAGKPSEADGYLEGGSFDTIHAGGRVSVYRDSYTIDFGLGYLDTDGSNISRTGDEDDGYRNATFNLTAALTPTERWRVEFFARHSDSKKQFDAIDFAQNRASSRR